MTLCATIRTSGTQMRVRQGDVVVVDRVHAELGSKIALERVLLIEDGEQLIVGAPHVPNASVEMEVLEHFRGKKVRVFKMRRRKKYRRTMGHRSELSKLRITDIKHTS